MTHAELCERAMEWLRGNRRCVPVLAGLASCREIPDAIGWSSRWAHHGSIVVECKTSVSDFRADAKKYERWRRPDDGLEDYYGWLKMRRRSRAELLGAGYIPRVIERMGDFRFYFCDAGVLSEEMVKKFAPDHGLLWREGRRVRVVTEAQRRENPNKAGEVAYLRYALIHVRDNLLGMGCAVDLTALTKFRGHEGLDFPARETGAVCG